RSRHTVPFSSARKASGVLFEDGRSYIIGAYSFVIETPDARMEEIIDHYAGQGMRVLCIARARGLDEELKGDHEVIGLVCIQDVLRPDIHQTLSYFYKQDVDIKIISGDDARTVSALAAQAGVRGKAVDMSRVKNVSEVVEIYSIFGRVTPEQKQQMVRALKKKGHTVAMTGDGVNDVMALKEADCSIAMGSGSQATKSVSSLVLMEDQFSAMPSILRQGRNVINNIQRSASLFLVKTIFSVGLAILSISFLKTYPFEPIQLSMVSSLGIGIPGFILTLEPNDERVKGNFLVRVFGRAIPAAFTVIVSVIVASLFKEVLQMSDAQFSTICTIVASWNSICMLYTVCVPLTNIRKVLLVCMALGVCLGIFVLNPIIGLKLVPLDMAQVIYLLCNLALIPDIIFLFKWIVDRTLMRPEFAK
ncbi:MAG: HAD-IC family P-type ATPase, partial [Erysipelotrichaceae bacterium]|nr:HAD-IC family P-type ATPase [Erysipelotrichaceae bacterium]